MLIQIMRDYQQLPSIESMDVRTIRTLYRALTPELLGVYHG